MFETMEDECMPCATQEPTPSGQLSDPFNKMCLASQAMTQAPRPSQRPPVPLFSQAAPQPSQTRAAEYGDGGDLPCSQLDYLATPDFITPADQFGGMENDPNAVVKHQRSPVQLSPNRIKRARRNAVEGDGDGMSAPGAGTTRPADAAAPFAAPIRRGMPRTRSPPCYRNVFLDNESEEDYSRWREPQRYAPSTTQLSRFRSDFKELGMLGQGSFSKVFRVRHRLDGKEYALKRTIKEVVRQGPEFLQFLQEVQVLSNVPPHPGIVRYYSSWTEAGMDGGERLFMQLELCSATLSLHAMVGNKVEEADMIEIARQVATALAHLHAHGVAHMDVKPSNIYLVLPEEDEACGSEGVQGKKAALVPPGTAFKLGDFGQAAVMAAVAAGTAEIGVNEGDCRYLPHEVMNSDYSRLDKADMFALGITLYEMVTMTDAPQGGKQYEDLRKGRVPFLMCSNAFKALIEKLLSQNPDDRPSAEKLLKMKIFRRQTEGAAPSPEVGV